MRKTAVLQFSRSIDRELSPYEKDHVPISSQILLVAISCTQKVDAKSDIFRQIRVECQTLCKRKREPAREWLDLKR
jgi:hypothetical protein